MALLCIVPEDCDVDRHTPTWLLTVIVVPEVVLAAGVVVAIVVVIVLRIGVYVFTCVCLFSCMCVCRINQKALNGFCCGFMNRWGIDQTQSIRLGSFGGFWRPLREFLRFQGGGLCSRCVLGLSVLVLFEE